MKKIQKVSIPDMMNLFMMDKSTLKRFGLLKLHQDFMMEKNYYMNNDGWFIKRKGEEKESYLFSLFFLNHKFLMKV